MVIPKIEHDKQTYQNWSHRERFLQRIKHVKSVNLIKAARVKSKGKNIDSANRKIARGPVFGRSARYTSTYQGFNTLDMGENILSRTRAHFLGSTCPEKEICSLGTWQSFSFPFIRISWKNESNKASFPDARAVKILRSENHQKW